MNNIKLLFMNTDLIGGRIISSFTFSNISHVAIVDPTDETRVYEAVMFGGVVHRHIDTCLKNKKDIIEVELPVMTTAKVYEARGFLESQKGKPYDWSGIFGGMFRRKKWNDNHAWYCSELATVSLHISGHTFFTPDRSIITPDQLYIACSQHGVAKQWTQP